MIVIFVFTAAFRALACVGEVSLALFAYRLLKAVPDNFIGDIQCKRSRLCILCVENENGSRTALNAFADLGESILHAAETVSLISEQICYHDHFGADIRNDLFEGRLVNFEYRIAVPGFAEPVCVTDQIGSDTVKQVRARFVAVAVVAVLRKSVFDHIAGRGLAVCSGDNYNIHFRGGNSQNILCDLHGNYAGERRAAAAGLSKDSAG